MQLIAWKDGESNLLVDTENIKCLTSVRDLNDEADSIYELYGDPNHMYDPNSVWNAIVCRSTRSSLQLHLTTVVKKIEIHVSN